MQSQTLSSFRRHWHNYCQSAYPARKRPTQFCMYFNCIVFNAVSHCLALVFYGQLLEQLSVALLSRPTVFSLLLLYCGQINDDDELQCALILFWDFGLYKLLTYLLNNT